MSCLAIIDAERLRFAKLVTEVARRNGGRTVTNVEVIEADDCLRFVACDIGSEAVVHPIELQVNAWNTALEAELVRLFRGSAQLALRNLGGAQ